MAKAGSVLNTVFLSVTAFRIPPSAFGFRLKPNSRRKRAGLKWGFALPLSFPPSAFRIPPYPLPSTPRTNQKKSIFISNLGKIDRS
jgi:hypothetical protein